MATAGPSTTSSETTSQKVIEVNKDSERPTHLWEKLQVKQTVRKLKNLSRKTPISPKKVRFVCISDTHNRTSKFPEPIPDGDVLLHAGDFTMVGDVKEVLEFNEFLGTLPHKHKIVIAGNHDLTFDPSFMTGYRKELKWRFGVDASDMEQVLTERWLQHPHQLLSNCTYLEDSMTEVYGITIYGSPWQPEFGAWGFNLPRGQACLDKWNMIPDGVDVLMTHGPPLGHGDLCFEGQRAGCAELLSTIQDRVKPKYHVFGHIHEAYGLTTDEKTTYVNACVCTLRYKPTNPAIIFDIPLPPGQSKQSVMDQSEVSVMDKLVNTHL